MRTLILIALAVLVAGCVSSGHINKNNQTQVVLSGDNYRVVKTHVQGSDTGTRILGLGVGPTYEKALAQVKKRAKLHGKSRALINITEDTFRIILLPFYSKTTLTITADVVEFGRGATTEAVEVQASDVLRAYVDAHNAGVRGDGFDGMVALFTDSGEMHFDGVNFGPLEGQDEISSAFTKNPPKDELLILDMAENECTYAWKKRPGRAAGKLIVKLRGEQITRLDVKVKKR